MAILLRQDKACWFPKLNWGVNGEGNTGRRGSSSQHHHQSQDPGKGRFLRGRGQKKVAFILGTSNPIEVCSTVETFASVEHVSSRFSKAAWNARDISQSMAALCHDAGVDTSRGHEAGFRT